MSQNIYQIYQTNPITSNLSTDLMYVGQLPYTPGDDAVITFANFLAQFGTSTPTASTLAKWDANVNLSANSFVPGYTTTATAAALTTLLVTSTYQQFFTGTTTQTVKLPATATLVLGQSYLVVNNSTGVVTVESHGPNTIQAMAASSTLLVTCISVSADTAAAWSADYNINTPLTLPLSPANGGTGVNNSTNTLTINANSVINQNVTTTGTPTFATATITGNATANNFAPATSVIVTIGGTTTINNTSTQILQLGGSGGTLVLPDATTLVIGWTYFIHNNSSGAVTIETNGGATLLTMPAGSFVELIAVTIAVPAGTWLYTWSLPQSTPWGTSALSNGGIVYSSSTSIGILAGTATANQILMSGASTTPTWSTATYPATAGTSGNVLTSNGTNWSSSTPNPTIVWTAASSTPITATVNTGYYITDASQVTITLPATAAAGSVVAIAGNGAGGWILAPGAGQTIKVIGSSASTSITSAEAYDCIEIICTVASTTWVARSLLSTGLTIS